VNEPLARSLTPSVLGILVRRGADFAAAEDAVQDALVEAVRVWPADPPRDPKGWLVTVAWRRFLDATRADAARRRREELGGAAAVGDVERGEQTRFADREGARRA
jgi:predicted RNA polymerase sigma factor